MRSYNRASSNKSRLSSEIARRQKQQRYALQSINRGIPMRASYLSRKYIAARDKVSTLNVKVEATGLPISSSTTADGLYAWSFKLNDLPDVGSYSAIWDQYRINEITAVFYPMTTNPNPGTTNAFAPIVIAVDLDDAGFPSSFSSLLQYDNAFVFTPGSDNKPYVRSFTPAATVGSYDGTNFNNKIVKKYQWIDLASPGVAHYGLKAVVRQQTTTNLVQYYIVFKYSVSFRATR